MQKCRGVAQLYLILILIISQELGFNNDLPVNLASSLASGVVLAWERASLLVLPVLRLWDGKWVVPRVSLFVCRFHPVQGKQSCGSC